MLCGSFGSGVEIQQLPRLLYNLARAHIQLGRAEAALGLYQKFLRPIPALQMRSSGRRAKT